MSFEMPTISVRGPANLAAVEPVIANTKNIMNKRQLDATPHFAFSLFIKISIDFESQ